MTVVRKHPDGDFRPFGRDATDETRSDAEYFSGGNWPEEYENISVSVWCGEDIEIVVSDMPSCITACTSLVPLLEENFKDSRGAGSRQEKIAFEKLRDCITKLIDIRSKELEDFPELGEGWPNPETYQTRNDNGLIHTTALPQKS